MSSMIKIDQIRQDGGTQMRVAINEDAVAAYAERMESGDEFPAVVVFYDGAAYWLADGFHRIAARLRVACAEESPTIETEVRAGRREDAIRFAVAANKTNGLRRTTADKQVAVRAALAHPEMRELSDRQIADEAGVSRRMVCDARGLVGNLPTSAQLPSPQAKSGGVPKRTGVDGKKYPVREKRQKKQSKPRGSGEPTKPKKSSASAPTRKPCPHCNGKGYIE